MKLRRNPRRQSRAEFMWVKPKNGTWSLPPDLSSLGLDVTEYAPLPMATLGGVSHTMRCVNAAFCRLVNKPRDQLVGRSFREMMPEKDICLTLLDRVFQTGQPETHTEQE